MAYPLPPFKIKLLSIGGDEIDKLLVEPGQIISDVKARIEELHKVPRRFQSLTAKGVVLLDTRTVAESGLQSDEAVVLVKEAVTQDSLVEALRTDLEILLPKLALDEDNPEVPREGADDTYQYFDGKRKREERDEADGFLKSICSHPLLASYMLASGADPNFEVPSQSLHRFGLSNNDAEPDTGGTALHYAAALGLPDVCKELLQDQRFNKVNLRNGFGRSALHCAAMARDMTYDPSYSDGRNKMRAEVCRLLVQDERCDVNMAQGFPEGQEEYIFGLKKEAPNGEDEYNWEPYVALHFAKYCPEIIEALATSPRLNPNITSIGGYEDMPILNGFFMFGLGGGNRDKNSLLSAMALIKHPSTDLNSRNKKFGNVTVPQSLLGYTDGHGGTEEEELVCELVSKFLDNNKYDAANCQVGATHGSETLLLMAAAWGSTELLQRLLNDDRFDPNAKSENMDTSQSYFTLRSPASGMTALHYASYNCALSSWGGRNVRAVLACNRFTESSVNAVDEFGRSAFYCAVDQATRHCGGDYPKDMPWEVLLEDDRVDVNICDKQGVSAFDKVVGNFATRKTVRKEVLKKIMEDTIDENSIVNDLSKVDGMFSSLLSSNRFFIVDGKGLLVRVVCALFSSLFSEDCKKNREVIDKLWSHPAITSLGCELLNQATEACDIEMCKRLLQDPRFTEVSDTALCDALRDDMYPEDHDATWPDVVKLVSVLLEDPRTDVNRKGEQDYPLFLVLDKLCDDEDDEDKIQAMKDIARMLLKDPRTDVNLTSKNQKKAIHHICGQLYPPSLDLCEILLKRDDLNDLNVQAPEDYMQTALHMAILNDQPDVAVVKMLCEQKQIDFTLKDAGGRSAIQRAYEFGGQGDTWRAMKAIYIKVLPPPAVGQAVSVTEDCDKYEQECGNCKIAPRAASCGLAGTVKVIDDELNTVILQQCESDSPVPVRALVGFEEWCGGTASF